MALKEKTPQTIGDVRNQLRFRNYYRSYIQDFTRIEKTIHELLYVKKHN